MGKNAAICGGKANFPTLLCLLIQTTAGQIIASLSSKASLQLQPVVLHSLFHNLNQLGAFISFLLGLRVAFRDRHSSLTGQYLDGLHKIHILGLADERNRITLRMTTKAVIEPFAVIDMEAGSFFLMKWARGPKIAFALVRFTGVPHDFTPGHLPKGQTGT